MKTTTRIIPLVVLSIVLGGCGGQEKTAQKDQKNYDVVQEGAASGVTSTIAGPGEAVPAVTGTNADTTTAFTLAPNVGGSATAAPGAIAGTLPPPASAYPVGSTPQMPPPMTSASRPVYTPSPARQRTTAPPSTDTSYPSSESHTTYRTDTTDTTNTNTTNTPPATTTAQTDTVATTNPPATTTTNPPAKKQEKKDEPQDDGEAEEEPPPPPPATTTTSGVQ